MKVCYILPHFYPYVGGGEQAFLDLIEALLKKKIEARVVTSSMDGKNIHQQYKGIDIYYYNWKSLFGHPLVQKKDLIEHIKWADVVHTAVYSPVRTACKLARKLKKPSIVTAHEVLGKRWFWIENNKIKALLFKLYETYVVKAKCYYFHTPSYATKTDLEKCNKKAKIENIYWIVKEEKIKQEKETKKFYQYFGITEQDRVFLNYGRPGKTKGVFVYLNAIEEVVKTLNKKELEHIKFCFIMAKYPEAEREKFIKQVKDHHLENYVVVKESVERKDLENYILCADYIVVPSITEGFGLSAIEACNAGKKLIYSSGGSLPEVTFGDVLEFINQDSGDLANKLVKVIKNEIDFTKKQRKDFSKETITEKMITLYNKVIDEERKK